MGEEAFSALSRLRSAMQVHGYNEGTILETVYRNVPIVEWLYEVCVSVSVSVSVSVLAFVYISVSVLFFSLLSTLASLFCRYILFYYLASDSFCSVLCLEAVISSGQASHPHHHSFTFL